jgi:hypothetical protein
VVFHRDKQKMNERMSRSVVSMRSQRAFGKLRLQLQGFCDLAPRLPVKVCSASEAAICVNVSRLCGTQPASLCNGLRGYPVTASHANPFL